MPLDFVSELNLGSREDAALRLLDDALNANIVGEAALVSSFGAESAILLHLASRVRSDVPVIFIDTQMLFRETLDYQLDLAQRFGLSDVRRIRPDVGRVKAVDPHGTLNLTNTDSCCRLRKAVPLEKALSGFDAWVSGRKRHQAATRAAVDLYEFEDGRTKVNPLAFWERQNLIDYMEKHNLPKHPLVAKGYPSIGCEPCTTPVAAGEDPRSGRWRGQDKVECGIHFENGKVVRPKAA